MAKIDKLPDKIARPEEWIAIMGNKIQEIIDWINKCQERESKYVKRLKELIEENKG